MYRYLGMNLHKDLNVEKMVANRVISDEELIAKITPFLRCASTSFPEKVTVAREIIEPRLLFGAEVHGMNKSIAEDTYFSESNVTAHGQYEYKIVR